MSEPKGCIGQLLALFGVPGPPRSETNSTKIPTAPKYQLRESVLSPAEFSFYSVLKNAVNGRAIILCKLRLIDVIQPEWKDRAGKNQIIQKHVDFLLCNSAMKPLCGIELDDKSHERADRKERDSTVDAAFTSAGLPLLHFAAKRGYNPDALWNAIGAHVPPA